jgi:uncharacterized membrane protein YphA (DoxX/SURF4 family)
MLLNIWLLRVNRSSPYRGGNAHTMRQEFAVYKLPPLAMYVVGTLKVGAAVCLIAGVWWYWLLFPATSRITILMVGAVAVHVKVHDPIRKAFPAAGLLLICAVLLLLSRY